jgi:hypothetical protein
MNMRFYPISPGVAQTHISQGEGFGMIDGGPPKKAKAFIEGLKKTPRTSNYSF